MLCKLPHKRGTKLLIFHDNNAEITIIHSQNVGFFSIFRNFASKYKNMNKVRITAIRQTVYPDLMAKYENPIEHACDVREGQEWISVDGRQPEGMCPAAWYSMREFVEALARGEGNFYDGWMQNPMSAMISCNDGFRPFSFYIEIIN